MYLLYVLLTCPICKSKCVNILGLIYLLLIPYKSNDLKIAIVFRYCIFYNKFTPVKVNVLWYPCYSGCLFIWKSYFVLVFLPWMLRIWEPKYSKQSLPWVVRWGLFECKCFHSRALILHNTQLLEVYVQYILPKWILVSRHNKGDVKIQKKSVSKLLNRFLLQRKEPLLLKLELDEFFQCSES